MSFFHASKAFDTWHSYVQRRQRCLAENNKLGCELIGNLNISQCFTIHNERLSSRIRLTVFNIFVSNQNEEISLKSQIISLWKRLVIYRRQNLGLKMILKNGWYIIWKMHDALTEERQGAVTQSNSCGNAELRKQQQFSKDMKMHDWISSWRWIKNTSVSWRKVI